MKIIKLEQDRIKVILSDSDLMEMNIDISDLTPNSPELSLFMCEVMDAVKAETGFSADQGQVIVEATSCDDGIVLMLTKIKKGYPYAKIRGVRAVKKNECILFEFADFDALLGMLINIDCKYVANMNLYKYMNRFYLAVPRGKIPLLIYEYSLRSRRSAVAESVVAEYGRLIAGGYKLADMALDLKKMY